MTQERAAAMKAKRVALAEKIMTRLSVMPYYISAFVKEGKIGCSEEPICGVYWLSEEQKADVASFETDNPNSTVFAVIHGIYGIGDFGDEMDATTFLFVTDAQVALAERNAAHGLDELTGILDLEDDSACEYYMTAFVKGYFDETGDVWLMPRGGGIHRTA